MEEIIKKVYTLSLEARENSYSPYSKFKVGAGLLSLDNKIITGCNVENISYGATICAERVAISTAVSKGIKNFKAIVISTNMQAPAYPCALCLQVISEFCDADFKIYLANLDGIKEEYRLKDFLPKAFKEFTAGD